MNPELVASLIWNIAGLIALGVAVEQLLKQRRSLREDKVIDSASWIRALKQEQHSKGKQ